MAYKQKKSSFDEDLEITHHKGQFPLPLMIISLALLMFVIWLFEHHPRIICVLAAAALAVPVIYFLISFIACKREKVNPTKLPPPRDYAEYLEQFEDEDSE